MANYFAFIDESGVLDVSKSEQPFFAVGFLRILETDAITEKLSKGHYDFFSDQRSKRKALLQELRETGRVLQPNDVSLLLASTRHTEYKFTHVTHTTLERYKALLDTVAKFPLHFCALVIDKTDPLFNTTIFRNYWHAYVSYSKLLCEKNCGRGDFLCVIADYMSKPLDSEVYFEKELNQLPNVFNSLRAHSETFTLLQVCDLLLGSVVFQWRQAKKLVAQSNRAAAKALFVEHLVSKLNVPPAKRNLHPLAQAITCTQPFYFSVWPLKLSKTTKSGGVQNAGLPAHRKAPLLDGTERGTFPS